MTKEDFRNIIGASNVSQIELGMLKPEKKIGTFSRKCKRIVQI